LPSVEVPTSPERFVECSDEEPYTEPPDDIVRRLRAPRCDDQGYHEWARALRLVASLISRHCREVHLVAAVPIPYTPATSQETLEDPGRDLMDSLTERENGPLAYSLDQRPTGLASAFVQLAYPWVRTGGSSILPEAIESPDAVLTGILARNALTRGTYNSAAGLRLADVYEVYPVQRRDHMLRPRPDYPEAGTSHSLLERVSLFGPTPDGLRLLSDVTTTFDESYRPASVNRLVASVLRAARRLGEDSVFESSGQRLWGRLKEHLDGLLLRLYQAGALKGASPVEAFSVRCDRTTMTQNDIDSGRIIARVMLNPSAPIDGITVAMALSGGGQVPLLPLEQR